MAQRKGMLASDLVYGLIFFFIIFAGMNIFYSQIAGQYSYSTPVIDKYNSLSQVSSEVGSMGAAVGNSTSATSSSTFFFIDPGQIWGAFKFFFGFQHYITDVTGYAAEDLQLGAIGDVLKVAVPTLLLLVVVFTAIGAAMRKEV